MATGITRSAGERYPLNTGPDIGPRSDVETPGDHLMNGKNSPFLARLDAVAAETETLLDRLLAATPAAGELSRPARLIEAMRYVSLGGGKRFRPFLVVELAQSFRCAAAERPDGGRRAGMRALLLAGA